MRRTSRTRPPSLELAEQLKQELEKNDRHVLSVASLRKTEEIEKLGRSASARGCGAIRALGAGGGRRRRPCPRSRPRSRRCWCFSTVTPRCGRAGAEAAGWRFLAGNGPACRKKSIDLRIKALETRVAEIKKQSPVDEGCGFTWPRRARACRPCFTSPVRMPDLWAGAVALGGTARPAIDSNRLFAANTTARPRTLALLPTKHRRRWPSGWKAAGYNLEWKVEPGGESPAGLRVAGRASRDEFPASIDCETGSPAFPRCCYWLEVTKFYLDAAERRAGVDARPAGGFGRRA